MGKPEVKQPGKQGSGSLEDHEIVEVVLRRMEKAVPAIERRIKEGEALTAESRFVAPWTVQSRIKKTDG